MSGSTSPEPPADDPYGGREPTAHERQAAQPWDASYRDGAAPWDIGAPQPAVVRLASEGVFTGAVLDVGCGTGDNALHLAGLGLDVLGVDVAETGIAIARERAAAAGFGSAGGGGAGGRDGGADGTGAAGGGGGVAGGARFEVADALHLERLDGVFDTVLSCALFHAFDANERRQHVASLASVTRPGARMYLLCFSDAGGDTAAPHPVTREELSAPFTASPDWTITSIDTERLMSTFAPEGLPAWLARIERT